MSTDHSAIEVAEVGSSHTSWRSLCYGVKQRPLRLSFGTKLALSVGLLTLATVGITAVVAWLTSSRLLTSEIETRLDTISEVREEHTSLYINNTFTALELIASRLALQDYLAQASLQGVMLTPEQLLYGNNDITNSIASYRGVFIAQMLTLQGDSLFSTEKTGYEGFFDRHPAPAMYPGLDGNVSDPYVLSDNRTNIGSDSSSPIETGEAFVFSTVVRSKADKAGTILGTLRLLISTNELFGILSGRAGLEGTRGQIVLVRPDDATGYLRFILPVPHDAPSSTNLPVSHYECLNGVKSLTTGSRVEKCRSYNDIEVEAASRPIHALPSWKLIVELPVFVVQTPILRLRNYLLIIVFATLVVALLLSAIWAHRAVGPLRRLRHAAKSFSSGAFSARAVQTTTPLLHDEITELTMAFNDMACDLEEMYHNLEQKVKQRTADLEVANSAKSSFLASVSHELRTPLNGINGLAELLADRFGSNSEELDMVLSIKDCGETLLTIVNDVLDFSKIEAGKLTLEERPVDIHRIVKVCAYLLQGKADEKGIALKCAIESDVPQWICSDPVRLQQIILNLMGNAVKFTHEGFVETRVTSHVDLVDKKHVLRFEVEDTGIGIPARAMGKLFQSFSQVDSSTTRKYGGTGLGLVISKLLIELLGGTLSVTSVEGKGSVFYFSIPIVTTEAPAAEERKNQTLEQVADTNHHEKDVKILLAEDNAVNVKVVLAMLKKLHFESVDVVGNGLLAVEAVEKKPYQIVLMDMQMPEMGGLEATRCIRQSQQISIQPIVIALTANAMEGDDKRCFASGMNDYLTKPINMDTMRDCLLKYVS